MGVSLDHTIVPVHNLSESIDFYKSILGFKYDGKFFNFEIIRINDGLTFDLIEKEKPVSRHYAFEMDRKTFDETFQRIKESGIKYGDGPQDRENMNGPGKSEGARGMADSVYFHDPSGHIIEIRCY